MQHSIEVIKWTIGGSLTTIIIFLFFIRYIITLYNKKYNEFQAEMYLAQLEKERTILSTRIEVQEETLQKISKELHDNINQLLTLAKLNLSKLDFINVKYPKLEISKDLLTKAIHEISNISNSLSSQSIKDFGLIKTIEYDCEKIKQINNTSFNINANIDISILNDEEQLLLYRIFQESVRNSIVHGKASIINISILGSIYNKIVFEIIDNGVGFLMNDYFNSANYYKNQGLKNIQKRAEILNATFEIKSDLKVGTSIMIIKQLNSN